MPFNIRGMDKEASAYARNERLVQKGRITTKQRDARNNKVLSDVRANCEHAPENDNGVVWCSTCGARLSD